uniref:LysR family transcriptional regulator n=1 Tax=Thaumasiovibrio occultus TaxID=1891184 RepID=UPI000B350052|nr:LysR family transcriptional regulator [Thaumasiovibrio occultus]
MFSLEQLHAFVATTEVGSFSAAARKLGKAQSVISQQIINMEIDCGSELFDRSGRYPILTTQGEQLLPYAQATISQFERLNHKAQHLFGEHNSAFVLAMDEGVPLKHLPTFLAALAQRYPMVQVECLSASSHDIIELVQTKRATTGLILTEGNLPHSLDFESIGSVTFDVYIAKDHPLASRELKNIDELKLYRQLVMRSKNAQVSTLGQQFSPDVWYADSFNVLLEMVKGGFGWGLLPEHLAKQGIQNNELLKLTGDFTHLAWQANIDVIQHQQWSSDPLHRDARKLLRALIL